MRVKCRIDTTCHKKNLKVNSLFLNILKWKNCQICRSSKGLKDVFYIYIFLFHYFFIFLFIHKHICNRHINKIKKTKAKIHKTVVRCKATITPEIKLKEEQLQN